MPIFSHTVTGYLFALLATVVWSGNFVVARGLAGALSPVELSFWRWSIAFLTILPFAGRSLLRSLPLVRGTWGKVILMALLGITCFNTFIYQAGHTTDATNMSLLATASPIVMAAIAHLFLRERLSRFQFFGLCGALCGVIILVSRGRLGTLLGLRFAQGDLWMLLSVFLFAVYSLMLRCRPKAFPHGQEYCTRTGEPPYEPKALPARYGVCRSIEPCAASGFFGKSEQFFRCARTIGGYDPCRRQGP